MVSDVEAITKLRMAVARFGEMDRAKWWNTKGLLGNLGELVSLPQILGMKFRKVNPNTVMRTAIMVAQAGTPVPSAELERAYLQGVDIEKVALAFIETQKRGNKASFQDLVDAELHDRLEEKLRG